MKKIDILSEEKKKPLEKKEGRKLQASIVIPAYNEESIIECNLTIICDYMKSLEDEFEWEIIVLKE